MPDDPAATENPAPPISEEDAAAPETEGALDEDAADESGSSDSSFSTPEPGDDQWQSHNSAFPPRTRNAAAVAGGSLAPLPAPRAASRHLRWDNMPNARTASVPHHRAPAKQVSFRELFE
jgi:hypothetical protein